MTRFPINFIVGFALTVFYAAPGAAGPFDDDLAAYKRGDYATVLQLLRPLAEQGDPAAQYNLGVMYQEGKGVAQSDAEAVRWYRRAIANGELELRLLAGQRLIEFVMRSVGAPDEVRVALVIGNSAYRNAAPLPHPANDAEDVAALLERLGFEVSLATDLDRQSAIYSIHAFANGSEGADIAVVYYAGHGIEVDGQNYLVPVDAGLTTDRNVALQTVSLNAVLRAIENAGKLGLVMLDVSSDDRFQVNGAKAGTGQSAQHDLARVEPVSSSVLIAYAANAGVGTIDGGGRNSPYTAALLEHLDDPDIDIRVMFDRVANSVMRSTDHRQKPFTSGLASDEEIVLAPIKRTPR